MKKIKILLSLCLFLVLLGVFSTSFYINASINQPVNLISQADALAVNDEAGAMLVSVQQGMGFSSLAVILEKDGVVENKLWIKIYARFTGIDQKIQAGDYLMSSGMSVRELLDKMVAGEVQKLRLTLVEGWTVQEVLAFLSEQENLRQTVNDFSEEELLVALSSDYPRLEGLLAADTYLYRRGDTDLSILQQAYALQSERLSRLWAGRAEDLPYSNSYQALIMASIIEKETGLASERPEIAGVFMRRLQKRMRLQTDPTVIYGLGDSYAGNITRAHLRQPTPYNTYVIFGLPPTPIAIVGEAALWAAVHPAQGASLYFVARGDGSHVFSNTLDQHNLAVREYQWRRRQGYRSSPSISP